jgi:hypothetical protein
MGAKRVAGLEAVGAHLLSATRVALPAARTLTDINTGELVTAKVKSELYNNKAQEKRVQQLLVTKPGSCDPTIADDKIEWRYGFLAERLRLLPFGAKVRGSIPGLLRLWCF